MSYTPLRPLILKVVNQTSSDGSIPAMKNRRSPYIDPHTGKLELRKNYAVQRFMVSTAALIADQLDGLQVETIKMPHRVVVVAEIIKFQPSTDVPDSDLDNQYTTLQELLQETGVMEDDRQVCTFLPIERVTRKRGLQFARLYIWQNEIDSVAELLQFLPNLHAGTVSAADTAPEYVPDFLSAVFNDPHADEGV